MAPKEFWDHIRGNLFFGKMSQGLVDNINNIVDCYYAERLLEGSKFELAYVLATARHECYHAAKNPDMNPVREGFTKTNSGAVAAVTKLFNDGKISRNYAAPDKEGKSWYGRGTVQITHKTNYERVGARIGEDLTTDPDRTLEPRISAKILVIGCCEGLFTGKKISDYIKDGVPDYVQMRRVVNGLDKAQLIAGYAVEFEQALSKSIAG